MTRVGRIKIYEKLIHFLSEIVRTSQTAQVNRFALRIAHGSFWKQAQKLRITSASLFLLVICKLKIAYFYTKHHEVAVSTVL